MYDNHNYFAVNKLFYYNLNLFDNVALYINVWYKSNIMAKLITYLFPTKESITKINKKKTASRFYLLNLITVINKYNLN